MPACSSLPARWTHALALACAALLGTVWQGPAVSADDSTRTPPASGQVPAKARKLDLSIGDISRYVDPDLLATPLPDELEEIIVRGVRPEPLPEQRVVPQGLGALIYAARNPLQAWRIFVPDPNVEIPERTEDDVREPPGAYRGKILEPGALFD